MAHLKQIPATTTYIVRQPVLRNGMPIETCRFNGDDDTTTTHFGFFESENLLGVVSLFETKNEAFIAEKQFQIRGMAVLENHQKKGIGNALILQCETFATQQGAAVVWFNAREIAVPFYIKMGFEILGTSFEIENIGTHYVMFRKY